MPRNTSLAAKGALPHRLQHLQNLTPCLIENGWWDLELGLTLSYWTPEQLLLIRSFLLWEPQKSKIARRSTGNNISELLFSLFFSSPSQSFLIERLLKSNVVWCPHPNCVPRSRNYVWCPPSQEIFFLCGVPPSFPIFVPLLHSALSWNLSKV